MIDFVHNIKLEKADYREVKESFKEFMYQTRDSLRKAMIKQIPEYAELDQTGSIIDNNIENVLEKGHFDMFQKYCSTMEDVHLMELEVYFCLGMAFAKDL